MGRKKKAQKNIEEADKDTQQNLKEEKQQDKTPDGKQDESHPLGGESHQGEKETLKKGRSKSRRNTSKDINIQEVTAQMLEAGPQLTWEEVGRHDLKDDTWVVIENNVYDLTKFKNKQLEGFEVILHRAGKEATKSFKQAKLQQQSLSKFFKGRIADGSKMESWQRQGRVGKMDLFCTVILGLGLTSTLVYLSL